MTIRALNFFCNFFMISTIQYVISALRSQSQFKFQSPNCSQANGFYSTSLHSVRTALLITQPINSYFNFGSFLLLNYFQPWSGNFNFVLLLMPYSLTQSTPILISIIFNFELFSTFLAVLI